MILLMQYIVMAVCQCTAQACCWYQVFRCCGCIESGPRHVEIEKQLEHTVIITPKPSDNPFVQTGRPKDPYFTNAYN